MQKDEVNAFGDFLRLAKWCIGKILIPRYAVDSSKMPSKRRANCRNEVKTNSINKTFMKKAYKGELLGISVKLDNFFLYVSLDLK